MNMITLHEHQKKAIERFENDKRRKVIIQECTGLGKTEIAIEIMKNGDLAEAEKRLERKLVLHNS